jgi:hypothetical protein
MAQIQTIQATDLITDSRADLNTNFANLNSDKIETSVIDTDTTLAANSDSKIPSQKAVKAYVDAGGATGFPTAYVTTSAGAADSGKGIKLNASGVLDQSFTTAPIVRTYLNAASPATWTKPAGLKYIIVEGVAGGGGGGAADDTGSSSNSVGAGGGGGGYFKKLIPVASLGATETVTIGAGGTAGPIDGTAGTGGTTSFGSHCSGTGGVGAGEDRTHGAGGTATGGDINIQGGAGDSGLDDAANLLWSGKGGDSFLGFGGASIRANGNGNTGQLYGGGGSGAYTGDVGDYTGSVGGAGIVIVTEYYN